MTSKSFAVSTLSAKAFNYIHCQIIKDWLLAMSRGDLCSSDVNRWIQDLGYTCPSIHRDRSLYVVHHIDTKATMEFDV